MKKIITLVVFAIYSITCSSSFAGIEEGVDAYNRKDWEKARNELLKPLNDGDPIAQSRIGHMFLNGYGVNKDIEYAKKLLISAADMGEPLAQNTLGGMYFRGKDIEKNIDKGISLMKLAADQGQPNALNNIGQLYFSGNGLKKDEYTGVQYLQRAAELGISASWETLGIAYLNGRGVEKDSAKAVFWLRKASERGHKVSQNLYGSALWDGNGVPKNREEAVKLFEISAQQGEVKSIFNLGVASLNGDGSDKDHMAACYYFKLLEKLSVDASLNSKLKNNTDICEEILNYSQKNKVNDWISMRLGSTNKDGISNYKPDFANDRGGRKFADRIDIPAQYTITTNKGCRLNNPQPKPNEAVTWSGACRNGYADGHGTLARFENGQPNGLPAQEYLSKGFFLKPGPHSIFRTAVGDDNCRIVVPVNAVENMKSLFSVEYDGKCPRNASNMLYQDSTNARANILFNGQLFASFNGTVAMGAIPISGEMIFFDGTRFKFNGQNPFSGIITQEKVDSWFKSIDVVRGAPQSPQLSAESLNIKVGFNAKPTPPVEASGKLLVFSVDTISSATKLTMRYDIAPSQKAKLSARGYVVSLKAEVKLDTTTSMGWMGVGENNSIVKLVDVRLDKKDGYRATGEVLLSELQSYAHGMGVTITTKASRPTVTVVGITEEQ